MTTANGFPIVIHNLRKTFGAQTVLDGISLQVQRGETLAILGRSGAGKSVLLKLLIRLQQPDSGTIRVAGKEVATLATDELNEVRKKVGFLFQQAALYDSLNVQQNVAFPLIRHTRMSEGMRNQRVHELLAQVGMERELHKMPSQLSGGMQKRVGLARALALEPEILLFDEPTAGLDPITADEIANLILELKQRRKMTGIVVTHDVSSAQRFSDRAALLHEGHILAEGRFPDLENNHEPLVQKFLGDAPRR